VETVRRPISKSINTLLVDFARRGVDRHERPRRHLPVEMTSMRNFDVKVLATL